MSHYYYLAPEIMLPFSPLTSQEFEGIRQKARELWRDETRWSASSVTTYSGSYREKQLDEAICKRLAQKTGQQQPEFKQISLLGSSAYNTLPFQAGSQEAADGKGGKPKKVGFELLMEYKSRGTNLLKQFQGQWDTESKPGSSEDSSETDQNSSDNGGDSPGIQLT